MNSLKQDQKVHDREYTPVALATAKQIRSGGSDSLDPFFYIIHCFNVKLPFWSYIILAKK